MPADTTSDPAQGPSQVRAAGRSGLNRRRIMTGALATGAALLAGPAVLAVEGPEEIGLPTPDAGTNIGGTGVQGGAGAGGGDVPVEHAISQSEPVVDDVASSTGMDPVTVDGRTYTAYTDTVIKQGQWDLYTCEFDVAYMIMSTFGVETTLDELVGMVGFDNPFEPYAEETPSGIIIYGGDIGSAFCGDLSHNTFSKTRGSAMRKAFEGFDFTAETVSSRKSVEAGLRAGKLMWLKTTVDFTEYTPTRWLTPDGTVYPTAYGNDHCVAAIGYDDEVVIIRDSLGPTNTNWDRPYEYDVPWDLFLDCWGSSGHDGLMIAPR